MSNKFIEVVEGLKKKYMCPDLTIKPYEIEQEQVEKSRFDEEDLHFEKYQAENITSGLLLIPPFYEDPVNLPATGAKFIRSTVDFFCGDLAKVTAEIGFWKPKSHDMQHKDYIVTDKNTVYLAYWNEQERWAFLRPEEWNKRKVEMEDDLSNPILRQMELDFFALLSKAVRTKDRYVTLLFQEDAMLLIEDVERLQWHFQNVPILWAVFKLYPQEMYDRVMKRVNLIYGKPVERAKEYIKELWGSEIINRQGPMLELDKLLVPVLFEGYEIVNGTVYSNVVRMYHERQQTERFTNNQTLKLYNETALELKDGKDGFVWFREVIKKYNDGG